MNSIVKIAAATAALLLAPLAQADSETEISFNVGSVLMTCGSDLGAGVDDEMFLEVFPQLVATLDTAAQEGKVRRVHYLTELKGGFFIVVNGDSLEKARENADEVNDRLQQAVNAAGHSDAKGGCTKFEIGPLAIAPR